MAAKVGGSSIVPRRWLRAHPFQTSHIQTTLATFATALATLLTQETTAECGQAGRTSAGHRSIPVGSASLPCTQTSSIFLLLHNDLLWLLVLHASGWAIALRWSVSLWRTVALWWVALRRRAVASIVCQNDKFDMSRERDDFGDSMVKCKSPVRRSHVDRSPLLRVLRATLVVSLV